MVVATICKNTFGVRIDFLVVEIQSYDSTCRSAHTDVLELSLVPHTGLTIMPSAPATSVQ